MFQDIFIFQYNIRVGTWLTFAELTGCYIGPDAIEQRILSDDKSKPKIQGRISRFCTSSEAKAVQALEGWAAAEPAAKPAPQRASTTDDNERKVGALIAMFNSSSGANAVHALELETEPAAEPAAEPAPQRASTSRMRGHNVLKVLAVLALLPVLCVPVALATLGGARDAPKCERVVLGAWRACDGVEGLMCAAPVETPAAKRLTTRFYVEDEAALEAGVQVYQNGTLTAPVGAAGFTLLAETRDTASGALAYVQPVVVPNAPFNGLALTVKDAVLAGATAVGTLTTLFVLDCLYNK